MSDGWDGSGNFAPEGDSETVYIPKADTGQAAPLSKDQPPSRNSTILESFVDYCRANPGHRFWQALRNWSGYHYILVAEADSGSGGWDKERDTFNWEGKKYNDPAPAALPAVSPQPMTLFCPFCGMRHIDEGKWATTPHRTHQCQFCFKDFRLFDYPTVGIAPVSPQPPSADQLGVSSAKQYRDPTAGELESPLFNAVWNAIKGWDVSRESNGLYSGATGTDVCIILDAIAALVAPGDKMLDRIVATLESRADGINMGGDIRVMRAVDQIVQREAAPVPLAPEIVCSVDTSGQMEGSNFIDTPDPRRDELRTLAGAQMQADYAEISQSRIVEWDDWELAWTLGNKFGSGARAAASPASAPSTERQELAAVCKMITEFDVAEGNAHKRNIILDKLYRWRNLTEKYLEGRGVEIGKPSGV